MITCQIIAESVSGYYGLPIREIYSRDRHPDLLIARHMGWRLARHLTRFSHPVIGRAMGGVRGPGVVRGIQSIEHKMRTNRDLVEDAKVLTLSIAAEVTDVDSAAALQPIAPPPGLPVINPIAIADAVLGQPIRDVKLAPEMIRCLALGVRAYFGELERVRGRLHAKPDMTLRQAAQAAAIAARDLESALGSRGEKPARNHLDKTLNALRNHFAQEKSHA